MRLVRALYLVDFQALTLLYAHPPDDENYTTQTCVDRRGTVLWNRRFDKLPLVIAL